MGAQYLKEYSVITQTKTEKKSILHSNIAKYIEITKPRIAALNILVAMIAMILAFSHNIQFGRLLVFVIVGFLGAGGAAAINSYAERDLDSMMARTKKRPLPTGAIKPLEKALFFGTGMNVTSRVLSWIFLNPLTSLFVGLGAAIYIVVYTIFLKKRTSWNIVIGGAAGSCAPLAGWAAATDGISLQSILIGDFNISLDTRSLLGSCNC